MRRHYERARIYLHRIRRRRKWKAAQTASEFQPWMLNGRPGNIEAQVKKEIAVAVLQYDLVVTSTTTGGHTPSSYHFPRNNPRQNGLGRAVDLAGAPSNMRAYMAHVLSQPSRYDEGFGPPNTEFVKHGRKFGGAIPNHYDHAHVAPRP